MTNAEFLIPGDVSRVVCSIYKYQLGHRIMWVQIKDVDNYQNISYIVFQGVDYFSGCTIWSGANIRVHDLETTRNFIHQLGLKIDDLVIEHFYKLYTVDEVTPPVAILAGNHAFADSAGNEYNPPTE